MLRLSGTRLVAMAMTTTVAVAPASDASATPTRYGAQPDDDPLAVYGGDLVLPCGWPTVVSLEGECTGTLIHPEVVVYASHCGADFGSVQFGESAASDHARSVDVQYCVLHPGGFNPGAGTDVAFCVLAEPQLDIPVVPPLMGCEADELVPGAAVTLVGFGLSEVGSGEKREATTELLAVLGNEAFLGGEEADACAGDSGAPVFVQMPGGGSWRAFGIASHSAPGDCNNGSYYVLMHTAMAWFESESGIDLTPCHDAAGNWDPSLDCAALPIDPAGAAGIWATGCSAGPLSGQEQTCGPPYDLDAPSVTLTSPSDGEHFELEPQAEQARVILVVEATDGRGSGIESIELRVDDHMVVDIGMDEPPYSYAIDLPPGGHTLDAWAIDKAGNEAHAPSVHIDVDEPDDSADSDDSDDSDDETGSTGLDGSETGAIETGDLPDALPVDGSESGTSADEPSAATTGGPAPYGTPVPIGFGCECRARPAAPPPWLLLTGLLGLGLRRRRRRRAPSGATACSSPS